jgi:hypothetical protein
MQNFITITTAYSWSLGHWSLGHWSLGHLVTWSLVNWSLSNLAINSFGRAHYNYAKIHYNHHRMQLITWSVTSSLLTWSLSHLENFPFKIVASMILFIIFFTGHWSLHHWSLGPLVIWSLSHLVINLSGSAHNNYAKFHYNRISGL